MSDFRIHILGGSGSGTTTLGAALAERLAISHFDTDRFFWLPSDPPFQAIRPVEGRQALLRTALESAPGWVLSGSLTGWGDFAIPFYTLVVWLTLPPEERLRRLQRREWTNHGSRIEPGGDLHTTHLEFMAYATAYDTDRVDMRTWARHERWVQGLPCPVLRLDGLLSTAVQVETVLKTLSGPQ